jgi:Zinc dependent phospholipase C
MPGPVAHHFIADSVARQLIRDRAIPPAVDGSPFLYFGAQGPDFLFLNTKDWPIIGGASRGIQFMLDVYGTLNQIKTQIKEAIDPVIEAARHESTTARQLIDLVRANQGVFALIEANVREGITAFVAENFGAFLFTEVIGHPEQKTNARYQDKTKWWWFDTLHYKRTGRYAQALMRNARSRGNINELAYALGYLTHYSADTVGHPYINILSGGPYRTHSQRHKVIENYHDTLVYNRFVPGGELAQSHLYNRYLLGGTLAFPRMPEHLSIPTGPDHATANCPMQAICREHTTFGSNGSKWPRPFWMV